MGIWGNNNENNDYKISIVGKIDGDKMEIVDKISPILGRYLKHNNMKDFLVKVNLTPGNSIKVKTINGILCPEHGMPIIKDIAIIVQDFEQNEEYTCIEGFIDTGATNTIISERLIEKLGIDKTRLKVKKRHLSGVGEIEVKTLSSITIASPEIDFHNIQWVVVGDIGKYDVALGNDVLQNCQFFYEGLSKTYTLKSYSI